MNVPINIKSAILCDDIRHENNGKAMLIGVYLGDVVVTEFPAAIRFFWYLMGTYKPSISGEIELKIAYDEDTPEPKMVMARTKMDPPVAEQEVNLILPGLQIVFTGPTSLTLSVKENGEWLTVLRKKILLGSIIGTNAPLQPS